MKEITQMQEELASDSFPIPTFTDPDRHQKLASAFPDVETVFKHFAEQRRIPGLAFGIVIDGELAYANGLGIQNSVTKVPVTPDSVFRIASMTKSFTAMSIIKLRDDGQLRLDDPAAEYVPELAALRYPTRDSAPITIRQLLSMAEGFPQDDPWADRQLAASDEQLSTWLRSGIPFSNPPGITFEYSNYGYGILGRVVANVSGMPYQVYVTQSILEPLNMTASTFDVHAVPAQKLAMGYRLEANEWVEEPPLSDGAFASMGGMFTTITDFARYMAFLLAAFPPRNELEECPVRRSSAREMQQIARYQSVTSMRQTPDMPACISSSGYGYGLVSTIDSSLGYSVAHGGGLPGYGSFYRMLPERGVGVVAFTNLTYGPVSSAVYEALEVLNKPGGMQPRKLFPSQALSAACEDINQLYKQWDDGKAAALSTESFFLDMTLQKRREQFERLRTDLGACHSTSSIQPDNALRGRWIMNCENGWLYCFITLAPTMPPRVQFLQVVAARSLSTKLRRAVLRLIALIQQWDDVEFRSLFAPQVKRRQIHPQLEALRVQYDTLRIGDVLEGDGENEARVRLLGERGDLDVRVVLDPKRHKLRSVSFTRPVTSAFVP